jgi:hypothetical protein
MTTGMAAPPVVGTVCAVAVAVVAQHAIPVQSTAASVARSRRDLGIFVAAYGVS